MHFLVLEHEGFSMFLVDYKILSRPAGPKSEFLRNLAKNEGSLLIPKQIFEAVHDDENVAEILCPHEINFSLRQFLYHYYTSRETPKVLLCL